MAAFCHETVINAWHDTAMRWLTTLLSLIFSNLLPRSSQRLRHLPRRVLLTLLALGLLPLVLLYYWAGLWLDEILFRRYRDVHVQKPLFILGVPRSGTTALHETLALDHQFTTTKTWECLLAPAISHRHLWTTMSQVDRAIGGPLRSLAAWLNHHLLKPLTQSHPLSATAPEEDYLTLLPQLSAFILIVGFPHSRWLWRLGRGDDALHPSETQKLMTQYRRSIQRHLYFHGPDRTYLAKNASHGVLVGSLLEAFPDARFIACVRPPEEVVSSQIASLTPALSLLHGAFDQESFNQKIQQQLYFTYTHLLHMLPQHAPSRSLFIPLHAQRANLIDVIQTLYAQFSLPMEQAFTQHVRARAETASKWRSTHQHRLADYNLDREKVAIQYAKVTEHFDFRSQHPVISEQLRPYATGKRVVVVCDAAEERNGVGSYYTDLTAHLQTELAAISLIGPETVPHWHKLPLPGDATQSLSIPSPKSLFARLAHAQPHVIIVATPGPYGLMATLMAPYFGARVIFGLHTDYEALAGLYWGKVRSQINRWGMGLVNRLIMQRADVVISNAEPMHKLAMSKGAKCAIQVSTPIARDYIDAPRRPLQGPLRRILFVGRLAAEKRIDLCIAAAEELPDWDFLIAGDGPERDEVNAAANRLNNLTALGWVPRQALREVIDSADILVLPSTVEAFGTVALEAMIRGRVALVSPGCGIADWPELAAHLEVMQPDESLTDALRRLAQYETTMLTEKAQAGQMAAQAMALQCIDDWAAVINNRSHHHASLARPEYPRCHATHAHGRGSAHQGVH